MPSTETHTTPENHYAINNVDTYGSSLDDHLRRTQNYSFSITGCSISICSLRKNEKRISNAVTLNPTKKASTSDYCEYTFIYIIYKPLNRHYLN